MLAGDRGRIRRELARCWRDSVYSNGVSQPFVGADAALASLAHPDGSISGPNVFSPVYATGQAVQGIERSWLPVACARLMSRARRSRR